MDANQEKVQSHWAMRTAGSPRRMRGGSGMVSQRGRLRVSIPYNGRPDPTPHAGLANRQAAGSAPNKKIATPNWNGYFISKIRIFLYAEISD